MDGPLEGTVDGIADGIELGPALGSEDGSNVCPTNVGSFEGPDEGINDGSVLDDGG